MNTTATTATLASLYDRYQSLIWEANRRTGNGRLGVQLEVRAAREARRLTHATRHQSRPCKYCQYCDYYHTATPEQVISDYSIASASSFSRTAVAN